MATPDQGRKPITENDLRALTLRQAFIEEANRIQGERLEAITRDLNQEMSARNFTLIKGVAGHANPALDEHDKRMRIETYATQRSQALAAGQTSIYNEILQALQGRGIPLDPGIQGDAAAVMQNLQNRLAENIKIVVSDSMLGAYTRVINAELRTEQLERDRLARESLAATQAQAARANTPSLADRLRQAAGANTAPAQTEQRLTPEDQEDFDREQIKNAERVDYFARALNRDTIDLSEWIANSGLKDPSSRIGGQKALFDAELEKLREVGIWAAHKDPRDTDPCASAARSYTIPGYFKYGQVGMWALTIGAASLTICAAAAGPAALMVAGPVLGLANLGAQHLIKFYYDRKFNQIFKEITREISDAGPMESGIAWAGIMIKFLQDYKPFMARSNRCDLKDDHVSTTIDAAISQLKQAALHGARSIQNKDKEVAKETFFKDQKFNDYINQNKDAMTALQKRWLAASDWALRAGYIGAAGGLGSAINGLK